MAKEPKRLSWQGSQQAQSEYEAAMAELRKKMKEKKRREAELFAKLNPKPPKPKKVDYHKYMKSKAWQEKREQAIRYWGSRCRICGSNKYLHVHHKNYKRVGHEKMKDLEILCGGCHRNAHEKDGLMDPLTTEFVDIINPKGL